MYYIGIDLGTTYSTVCVMNDDDTVPKICKNPLKHLSTPSVVWFKNGEIIVGEKAVKGLMENTEEKTVAICDSKRSFGDKNTKWVVTLENGEKQTYTPEDVATLILKEMTQFKDVKKILDSGEQYRCVITRPASYDSRQNQLVIDAAIRAGFNQKGLDKKGHEVYHVSTTTEPTAAAISYCITQPNFDKGGLLIFDLGGGTFDTTTMWKDGNVYRELVLEGISHLGGRDWDARILLELQKQYAKHHKISQSDVENDPTISSILKSECEEIKKCLTASGKFEGCIYALSATEKYSLNQEEFEECSKDLLDQAFLHVDLALEESPIIAKKRKIDDFRIDAVVLVGGSSKMKQIEKNFIEKYPQFNDKVILVEPDMAIAKGAAYWARYGVGAKEEEKSKSDIKKTGTTDTPTAIKVIDMYTNINRSYGVKILDHNDKECINNLIFINDEAPLDSKTNRYVTTSQSDNITIEIYSNVSSEQYVQLNDVKSDIKIVGKFVVEFGHDVPAGTPVKVKMHMEQNTLTAICIDEKKHETVKPFNTL